MTINTGSPCPVGDMVVVLTRIKDLETMALATQSITFDHQLTTVRVMTVCANHSLCMHFTLQERAKHKGLFKFKKRGGET